MQVTWKSYKKFIIPLLVLPCLVGCSNVPTEKKDEVTVCLVDGKNFVARGYVGKAKRGEDISFQISLFNGYEVERCSYENVTVSQTNGECIVTLHNVMYSCRVSLSTFLPQASICYDYNGGELNGNKSETVVYKRTAHPRVNTPNAVGLEREGYVLTGWNTSADGKGEHIGLGSRVTAEKQTEQTLYAEWEQETESSAFTYETVENEIRLLNYSGAVGDKLVVPSKINGKSVTTIAEGFAKDRTIGSLVLPNTLETIEENAFSNCEIAELYFFDSIVNVSDESFSNQVPHTWHINAELAPRYMETSYVTVFADKMDYLLLNANRQKLIIFGGCSVYFGLDSSILAKEYSEYAVLNLGTVGGTNAAFQYDIMRKYIGEGDVFVHAPEQASPYQLMADLSCENRVFIATEGNFDLLALTDMTKMEGAFKCFSAFNSNRRKLEPCSYEDAFEFNEYGDNTSVRPNIKNYLKLTDDYEICAEFLTENSLNALCDQYDLIEEQGARVYVSYAPINKLCVEKEKADLFSSKLEKGLYQRGYAVISDIYDYSMEPQYFFDEDYHLTNEGAEARTKQLLNDLKKVL